VEQMENQLEPEHTPERKIHLYHCDHSGAGLAMEGAASLSASEADVSPGKTDSKGAMMGGGLLGKFSIAGTKIN